MLARLRASPSQKAPLVTSAQKQADVATAEDTPKQSSPEPRQSKLRKKKVRDTTPKSASAPVFVAERNSTSLPDTPLLSDTSVPFGVYESEFRLASETREEDYSPDPVGVIPDRTTLPVFDLRRDDFTASHNAVALTFRKTSPAQPDGETDRDNSSVQTHSVPNRRHSYSDVPCSRAPRKLVKKPASEGDPSMSPLSALKRRFSYVPCVAAKLVEKSTLSEDDIKRLSITATRRPEFSSDKSNADSPSVVQVTIVDQLPHQQASPRLRMSRRTSSLPSIIPEGDVNEEFLEEQEEVLSYLHNTLLIPPFDASPRTAVSDGGLPQTPPSTQPKRHSSFTSSPASFVGSMRSEFPYLLGEQSQTFEISPLHPKHSSLYGLGLDPTTTTNINRYSTLKFPPSPPQSVGRGSTDETQFILDELASESRSMKSVVDAINNACTPRTSFDYTDEGSIYEFDDSESSILPSDQQLPFSSQGDDSYQDSLQQDDNDSIYSFAAPILRNARSREPSSLTRSSSQSTEFETPNLNVRPKSRKPNLPPLITTSISTGNYGPPLKRRSHVRGKRSASSPISATVFPTMVKVVEEEMVEYTPTEDNGWMRQRRISRDGTWIVVEREILEKGAI